MIAWEKPQGKTRLRSSDDAPMAGHVPQPSSVAENVPDFNPSQTRSASSEPPSYLAIFTLPSSVNVLASTHPPLDVGATMCTVKVIGPNRSSNILRLSGVAPRTASKTTLSVEAPVS